MQETLTNKSLKRKRTKFHFIDAQPDNEDQDIAEIDIYVPTRNIDNVNCDSIDIFSQYARNVYIVTSELCPDRYSGVAKLIQPTQHFSKWFSSLEHHKYTPASNKIKKWGLPLKRNFISYHAIMVKSQSLIMIDDDIEPSLILKFLTSSKASCNRIISCPSLDFPDKSVVGHIAMKYGLDTDVMPSGQLCMIPSKFQYSIFPQVYNEDWLFFYLSGLENVSKAFGSRQSAYGYLSLDRARFQAFGDLIAESIFSVGDSENLQMYVSDLDFWRDAKEKWVGFLDTLVDLVEESQEKIVLAAAREAVGQVKPKMCLDFMGALLRDNQRWREFLEQES